MSKTSVMRNTHGPMIQRASSCACGGGCPSCQQQTEDRVIQPKLNISSPTDRYEQEAERVAERIGAAVDPHSLGNITHSNRASAVQRKCDQCNGISADDGPEQEEVLQPKLSTGGASIEPNARLDANVLRQGGQSLPNGVRAFFEPHFGVDFSNVRVHHDNQAAESARSINALAFTSGHDVFFAEGQYAPATAAGKKLLAHELTHTIQQSGKGSGQQTLQRTPDDQKDTPAKPPPKKVASACPTFVSLTATIQAPKVSDACNSKCRLELGCCTTPRGSCGTTKDSGAAFKGTIEVPKDCTGELGLMQNLLSSDRKRTTTGKSKECLSITSTHADGGVPWKGCKVSVTAAGTHTIESDDCPFMELQDTLTAASISDSFKMFLIWKTSTSKGWHTIGKVEWSWSAATALKKGKDCASKWTAPGGKATTVNGEASTESPVSKPSAQDVDDNWAPCDKK
jgi:ribosomal protein L44E